MGHAADGEQSDILDSVWDGLCVDAQLKRAALEAPHACSRPLARDLCPQVRAFVAGICAVAMPQCAVWYVWS